jgi:hypothetical protein
MYSVVDALSDGTNPPAHIHIHLRIDLALMQTYGVQCRNP